MTYYCSICDNSVFRKQSKMFAGKRFCRPCIKKFRKSGLDIEQFALERRARMKDGGKTRLECPKCHSTNTGNGPNGRYHVCRNCKSTFKTEEQKAVAEVERKLAKAKIKAFAEMQRKETEGNRLRREFKERPRG